MKPSDEPAEFCRFLEDHRLVFACAESCTGGLLAEQITGVPGASRVFWGGLVTYSNEAKERLLGVDPGLISSEGAVSGEVALAMVLGVAEVSRASLAVSITGVAGPDGGTEAKPVGTVWVGLAARASGDVQPPRTVAVRLRLDGDRAAIRQNAAFWSRNLAMVWWRSGMDLDSLRALTDNKGKSTITAFLPPSSPSPL